MEMKEKIYSKPYARIAQISKYLEISDTTIRRYIKLGILKTKILGSCTRILTSSLKEFEETQWQKDDIKQLSSALEGSQQNQTGISAGQKQVSLEKFQQAQKMKQKLTRT